MDQRVLLSSGITDRAWLLYFCCVKCFFGLFPLQCFFVLAYLGWKKVFDVFIALWKLGDRTSYGRLFNIVCWNYLGLFENSVYRHYDLKREMTVYMESNIWVL